MRSSELLLILSLVSLPIRLVTAASPAAGLVEQAVTATGMDPGLMVVLGGNGSVESTLAQRGGFLAEGLRTNPSEAHATRVELAKAGIFPLAFPLSEGEDANTYWRVGATPVQIPDEDL